jgi:spermidine dehydrogenase
VELLSTSFETIERSIRDSLGRALGGGGFDPARDILGITVNRWPHGHATKHFRSPTTLGEQRRAARVARQKFGCIPSPTRTLARIRTGRGHRPRHRAVAELLAQPGSEK